MPRKTGTPHLPFLDQVTGALGQLRFGRGVIGKTSYVVMVALIVLGVVAWRMPAANVWLWFALLAVILLVVAVYVISGFLFADRNPGAALLEGGDLITFRMIDQGAKGLEQLPQQQPIPNPLVIVDEKDDSNE